MTGEPATGAELLRWSEALAGIVRTGLGFTTNTYERERYEEVLAVAAEIRFRAAHDVVPGELVAEWMRSVGDGIAGYPTGWADIGYSAAEVAVKEVREETGIICEPVRLIAVLDGLRQGFTRIPMYSLVFHCRMTGGSLEPHPLECADVGFFAEDDLPDPVAGVESWGEHAFAAIRGEVVDVQYDLPRPAVWAGEHHDTDGPVGEG
jgi:ADP-ribose pyrophosphatase YjhB (NUDIX family)